VSVLALCLSVLLTLGLSGYVTRIGERNALRVRAQIAADSAALAAVAESAPYGSGDVEGEARSFAVSNGARLVDCLCRGGGSAVQVAVEISGVRASARAVLDPLLLMPASMGFPKGMDPRLELAVGQLVAAARGRLRVISGWRSSDQQTELWQEALHDYGSPESADDWVARPGTSMHERGLAVDLGGDLDLAVELIDRLGLPLRRTLLNEPWHFELVGSARP
jgi:hypothetical protein